MPYIPPDEPVRGRPRVKEVGDTYTSKYHGVSFKRGSFHAYAQKNGKQVLLLATKDEELAARTRDEYVRKHYVQGTYTLNFPDA